MASFGMTDKGLRRPANQDSFQIETKGNTILGVVADGIGGNRAGDVASLTACQAMVRDFEQHYDMSVDKQQWLLAALNRTNRQVYNKSLSDQAYSGMGTTLVGFISDGKETCIVNVGDSRCYAVVGNRLIQITEDHTLLNDLVKRRGFDYEIASSIIGKNVISKAVGVAENTDCDLFEISDFKYLLLCSDGLHGYVDDGKILKVMLERNSLQNKCRKLIKLANDAGGYDNITVVIYQR